MTLNQLISKATKLSQQFTTGDIPIYVDGWEVDIDLKDVGENGDYRIIMEVNKKPIPLPEIRIIDEIEVTVDNLKRFHEMLNKGLLKAIHCERGIAVSLDFADDHTSASNGDWLIQDEQERWWVMNKAYHRNMVAQGKIIRAER